MSISLSLSSLVCGKLFKLNFLKYTQQFLLQYSSQLDYIGLNKI